MQDGIFFLAAGSWIPTVMAAIFGLLIGSFLNVVIHHLPIMMQSESDNYVAHESDQPHTDRYNLLMPRSACSQCQQQIGAVENGPIFRYLAFRSKCKPSKTPISARYPVVAALTGALSALLIWHFGSGWSGLASLVLLYMLIVMTFIDTDTQLLPDDLTLPLLWIGLLLNLSGLFVPLHEAVIGATVGYLSLWSIYWLFKLLTGKAGMGYGDFKLLAALGAWMGWKMLPIIILFSSLVGTVVGLALIVFFRQGRDKPIPFGPYLAAAGLLALLYGHTIMGTYFVFLPKPS